MPNTNIQQGTTDKAVGQLGLPALRSWTTNTIMSFEHGLKQLRKAKRPTQVLWTVTPGMATLMLEANFENNRNKSANNILKFAADMQNKKWYLTGQGLSFDSEGYLIDGQTRLTACINSGKSFKTFVLFGCDPEAKYVLDTGKSRSAADIFKIVGVDKPNPAAATTRAYAIFAAGADRNSLSTTGGFRTVYSAKELHNIYLKNTKLQEAIETTYYPLSRTKLMTPGHATALLVVMGERDPAAAKDFYKAVFEGLGIKGEGDPAHVLRTKLLTHKAAPTKKLTNLDLDALFIKAWNDRQAGVTYKSGHSLSFRPKEKFPTID
jgi:hypothetical protein